MIDTGTATRGIRVDAQLAEEQEDDEGHEHEGDDQRAHDLLDGRGHEHGGIPEHVVDQVVGEALLQIVHDFADMARDVDGIGAGRLENADRRRRRTVEAAVALLALGAQVDAGDVLDPHDRAVGIGAHDDIVELVGPRQPALRS